MESWRDRIVAWPLWRVFALTSAAFLVILVPLVAVGPARMSLLARVALMVSVAIAMGAYVTFVVWLFRRREEGVVGALPPAARVDVAHALRVGTAPGDPALDEAALALIDRRRTKAKRTKWVLRSIWVVVLAFVVTTEVVRPSVSHLAMVVLYLVLPVASFVSLRRQFERFDRSERAIRDRAAEARPAGRG
jgi:hypothetical protein